MAAKVIRRRFVDLDDGQIHYRTAGEASSTKPPLVMIHASPASSKTLEPLIAAMAQDRLVIAPDTVGNGDSVVPIPEGADIGFFAGKTLAALDRLELSEFDLYGTHTGGSIAAEMAIRQSRRVKHLILDGIGLYDPALQAELLERYAPAVTPDHQGMYVSWAWHFVRDTFLFWPWYRLDAAHRRPLGLPEPVVLHDKFLEVLKAISTYHHSYRAAFRYDKRQRFELLTTPTLTACARTDMLAQWHDELRQIIPGSRTASHDGIASPEALVSTCAIFRNFLDGEG